MMIFAWINDALCRPHPRHDTGDRSLDQLVREHQEQDRDRHAEGLGGFEIDDELEFGWLLHRQFSRLRPTQNPINILSRAPELVGKAWPIGNETVPFDVITRAVHRRQSSA